MRHYPIPRGTFCALSYTRRSNIGEIEARPGNTAFALSKDSAIFSERYLAANWAERGMFSPAARTAALPEKLDRVLLAFPVRLLHVRKSARAQTRCGARRAHDPAGIVRTAASPRASSLAHGGQRPER